MYLYTYAYIITYIIIYMCIDLYIYTQCVFIVFMEVVFLQGLNMTGSSDSQCVDSAPRTQIPSDATLRQ